MHDIAAIALFCDDIREEKSGAHSLIGIIGDNVIVPNFPGAIPKFGIYVRIHIPTDFKPCKFDIYLNYPNGDRLHINEIELRLVKNTIVDAKKSNNPIAGIFTQLVAAPFPVAQEGRISVELSWNGVSSFIGSLNFIKAGNIPKHLKMPTSPSA